VWNYCTICSIVHMHSRTTYIHITHLLWLYFLSFFSVHFPPLSAAEGCPPHWDMGKLLLGKEKSAFIAKLLSVSKAASSASPKRTRLLLENLNHIRSGPGQFWQAKFAQSGPASDQVTFGKVDPPLV